MNRFRENVFVLIAALAFFCMPLLGQPAGDNPAAKSPVELFRELLAMTPAQREEAIANRPPGTQKRILEKLNEYELLPDELRNLRLRETELRWYLRPLMDQSSTNRTSLLAQVPQELRGEITERLQRWDLLPPDLRDQFKDNDLIASYFAQTGLSTEQQRKEFLEQIPPERQEELKKGFDHWKTLSDADRQKTLASFNKFFELTPEQKEQTLDAVSDDEREQMKKTLASYANLTPAQRAQCITSFEKFARMSVGERQQFLKNAERWREMTPEERENWRQLVTRAPIMPPEYFQRQPESTNRSSLRVGPALATN